jgi:hypothetical protein
VAQEVTQAKGDMVILRGRDDLTEASNDGAMITLITTNAVTSIPDNVGVCEVISVGQNVHNVKPGDIVFIDFCDVAQGYVLEAEELYVAPCHAFRAFFDPKTGVVAPMPGYVVTKRSSDRMKVALTGTDRVEVPPYILTQGIAGGKTSGGDPTAFIIYEEVVSIGDVLPVDETYSKRETMLLGLLRKALDLPPLPCDFEVGELVAFCTEFSTPVRVKGEFMRITPACRILCSIDDAWILDKAIREGRAGKLLLVG